MARPQPIKYKVHNPEKYSGDLNNVVMRSSWERRLVEFLDTNPNVLAFGSEHTGTIIPYISPKDNAYHRYFPDFIARVRQRNGNVRTILIEVKPHAETLPPKKPLKKTNKAMSNYRKAVLTYAINQAKWKAARAWCEQHDAIFQIMDEYSLGLKTR
jgi:hypothetical protein